MLHFLLLLLVLLFPIVLLSYNFYFKRRHLPPGPAPLPLIGNLHSLQGTMPEERFAQWRRQFGDVFTFWMGEKPVVCVVDYAKIIEHFQKDADTFSGRHVEEKYEKAIHGTNLTNFLKKLNGGVYGVIMTEGELWREQRRFALQVLRDFGLSKGLMQERILQESHPMFLQMDTQIALGDEVDMGKLLDVAVGSIINNLLFGYRFDQAHLKEFHELKQLLHEEFDIVVHPLTALFQLSPNFFRCLPFFSGVFDRMCSVYRNIDAFFERQMRTHMKEIDEHQWDTPSTDLVEAFLKEKAKRDATGEQHNFTLKQLKGLCNDLWIAGQETTGTTLAWGIAYMVHYPQIQAKMRKELKRQASNSASRVITVSDKPELPYTNAEIQRMANLVALNVVRKVGRDVTIDGYRISKGTAVCPQISNVLMDEKIFDSPAQFRPERFLDMDGKLKRVNELIPFSVGKRQCLGESLARMELFLFVANLFKQYEFSSGAQLPSLERRMSATIHCPHFTCRVQKAHFEYE